MNPPVLIFLFTRYRLVLPLLSDELVSILPSTTGNCGAKNNDVLPSSFLSIATTSNVSDASIAIFSLSIETPFSFPICIANVESLLPIAFGLEMSNPRVPSLSNVPVLDALSSLVKVLLVVTVPSVFPSILRPSLNIKPLSDKPPRSDEVML